MNASLVTYAPTLNKFRERLLALPLTSLNTGWEDVLVPHGLALCGQAWEDEVMVKWAYEWAAHHLTGEVAYGGDSVELHSGIPRCGQVLGSYCGDWGFPLVLVPLYVARGEERFKDEAVKVCDHIIKGSVRIGDNLIAHGAGGILRRLWVDTLYYTSSPLAMTYSITGHARFAEEAVRQCLGHAKHLQDPITGCFFHDAVVETNERTHWFWSRGNGWVILALADTLRACPPDTPGYAEVLSCYRSLVSGLMRYQQPCGMWRIVPEDEESHLETSGTIMILCGILMGVRDGLLPRDLAGRVKRGLAELMTWVTPQGALVGAQRPAGLGGWETHKHSTMGECTYATGMFLRLLAEVGQAREQFELKN